jgi:hypothetical protein
MSPLPKQCLKSEMLCSLALRALLRKVSDYFQTTPANGEAINGETITGAI